MHSRHMHSSTGDGLETSWLCLSFVLHFFSFSRFIFFDAERFPGTVKAAIQDTRVLTDQELEGISTRTIMRPLDRPLVDLADNFIQAIRAG